MIDIDTAAYGASLQKAIQAQAGDGKLAAIEESDESGESAFEVTFSSKTGVERHFTVATDGTLLTVEVELREVPSAVQKAIHEQAAGWELKSIDKNLADVESSFDVEVKKDGREKTFTTEDDGTLSCMSVALAETPPPVQA